MNPTKSIIGIIHQVSIAPPVINTSTKFMEISIDIMEIIDIPKAVFNARRRVICELSTIVSSIIELRSPITMARLIIAKVDQGVSVN